MMLLLIQTHNEEMKTMDTINDNLSLTVINDGDGSQCGATYKERCEFFSGEWTQALLSIKALAWVRAANQWMMQRDYEGVCAAVLLEQAAKVTEYYAEHVTQLVRSA